MICLKCLVNPFSIEVKVSFSVNFSWKNKRLEMPLLLAYSTEISQKTNYIVVML